jgi:hypothetical protein
LCLTLGGRGHLVTIDVVHVGTAQLAGAEQPRLQQPCHHPVPAPDCYTDRLCLHHSSLCPFQVRLNEVHLAKKFDLASEAASHIASPCSLFFIALGLRHALHRGMRWTISCTTLHAALTSRRLVALSTPPAVVGSSGLGGCHAPSSGSERAGLLLLCLLVANTGLLLVDHIHFQYNGVVIGARRLGRGSMPKQSQAWA